MCTVPLSATLLWLGTIYYNDNTMSNITHSCNCARVKHFAYTWTSKQHSKPAKQYMMSQKMLSGWICLMRSKKVKYVAAGYLKNYKTFFHLRLQGIDNQQIIVPWWRNILSWNIDCFSVFGLPVSFCWQCCLSEVNATSETNISLLCIGQLDK